MTITPATREETIACTSPEPHPTELSPVKASVNRPLVEPAVIDNVVDNLTPGIDETKADSDRIVQSGSNPSYSDVATDLTSGHAAPQAVDSSPVTDTPLNDDVLWQCVTQTIHRFSLLVIIIIIMGYT